MAGSKATLHSFGLCRNSTQTSRLKKKKIKYWFQYKKLSQNLVAYNNKHYYLTQPLIVRNPKRRGRMFPAQCLSRGCSQAVSQRCRHLKGPLDRTNWHLNSSTWLYQVSHDCWVLMLASVSFSVGLIVAVRVLTVWKLVTLSEQAMREGDNIPKREDTAFIT